MNLHRREFKIQGPQIADHPFIIRTSLTLDVWPGMKRGFWRLAGSWRGDLIIWQGIHRVTNIRLQCGPPKGVGHEYLCGGHTWMSGCGCIMHKVENSLPVKRRRNIDSVGQARWWRPVGQNEVCQDVPLYWGQNKRGGQGGFRSEVFVCRSIVKARQGICFPGLRAWAERYLELEAREEQPLCLMRIQLLGSFDVLHILVIG